MTAETATAPVPSDTFNASDYLLQAALRADTAGRTAVTGPGGDLSYGELAELAGHVSAGLQAWGLRAEERVVLSMADGPSMAAAILGAMRLGAVPVPVSTMLTGPELAALMHDARARVLLVSDRFAETAEGALARGPGVRHVGIEGNAALRVPPGVRPHLFAELVEEGRRREGRLLDPYPTSDDSSALWLYTSGTTGKPKGAMHRHANIRHVVETYGRQVLGITSPLGGGAGFRSGRHPADCEASRNRAAVCQEPYPLFRSSVRISAIGSRCVAD